MYTAGTIIYFDPYYFDDGGSSKRKYFLVLKNVDDTTILASLPSSKVHLPNFVEIKHGCVDLPSSCISCYIFESKKAITTSGWSFDLHTFLYGNWIDDHSTTTLQERYQIEGVDYEIIGRLTDHELNNVINCFVHSAVVKRRYRRMLMQ